MKYVFGVHFRDLAETFFDQRIPELVMNRASWEIENRKKWEGWIEGEVFSNSVRHFRHSRFNLLERENFHAASLSWKIHLLCFTTGAI